MEQNNGNSAEKNNHKTKCNDYIEEFPSGGLMLSVVLKEYEYETERNKGLQVRTGMLMAFVGALLVFLPAYLKVPKLSEINVTNAYQAFPYVMLVIFDIVALIFLIISIIYLVRVISTDEYRRLSLLASSSAKPPH